MSFNNTSAHIKINLLFFLCCECVLKETIIKAPTAEFDDYEFAVTLIDSTYNTHFFQQMI